MSFEDGNQYGSCVVCNQDPCTCGMVWTPDGMKPRGEATVTAPQTDWAKNAAREICGSRIVAANSCVLVKTVYFSEAEMVEIILRHGAARLSQGATDAH